MWKLPEGPCSWCPLVFCRTAQLMSSGSAQPRLSWSRGQRTGPSPLSIAAEGWAGGAHVLTEHFSQCHRECQSCRDYPAGSFQNTILWFKQQPIFGHKSTAVTQHFNLKRRRDILPHSPFLYVTSISQDILV